MPWRSSGHSVILPTYVSASSGNDLLSASKIPAFSALVAETPYNVRSDPGLFDILDGYRMESPLCHGLWSLHSSLHKDLNILVLFVPSAP